MIQDRRRPFRPSGPQGVQVGTPRIQNSSSGSGDSFPSSEDDRAERILSNMHGIKTRGKETRYLLGNGAHLALSSLVVTRSQDSEWLQEGRKKQTAIMFSIIIISCLQSCSCGISLSESWEVDVKSCAMLMMLPAKRYRCSNDITVGGKAHEQDTGTVCRAQGRRDGIFTPFHG